MRKLALAAALTFVAASATAQTPLSWYVGNDRPTVVVGDAVMTGCDSNDKTPREALDCKVRYWRDEVERRGKLVDEAQKLLDAGKERLRAFEDARR